MASFFKVLTLHSVDTRAIWAKGVNLTRVYHLSISWGGSPPLSLDSPKQLRTKQFDVHQDQWLSQRRICDERPFSLSLRKFNPNMHGC